MSSDPTPGDPERVRQLSVRLQNFADDAEEALSKVQALVNDGGLASFVGLTAEAFRDRFDKVPPNLTKLHTSYDLAASALARYWPRLESAQSEADSALTEAVDAKAELDAARARLASALTTLEGAEDAADPPDEDEVSQEVKRALADAKTAHGTAETAVANAENRLEIAIGLARQAKEAREEAAEDCANDLDEASDAGMQNKKWWQKAVDWVVDNWDTIVAIARIVVAVLGVIVMIIGGPLAWIVLAAALIVLADTLIKYANGEASLWDVAFAALDCIPGFKGLTTAAGLMAGMRNLGRNLRNVAGDAVSAARRNPPPNGRPPAGRCRNGDPIDMVTGEMFIEEQDVQLPGVLPLVLRRTHLSTYRFGRFHGTSWASTLDERLEIDGEGVTYASEDGLLLIYPVPRADRPVHPTVGPRMPLTWDGTREGIIRISDPATGWTRHFAPLAQHPEGTANFTLYLVGITDRSDNTITIDRDDYGLPTAVRHSGGYHIDVDTHADRITALRLRDAEAGPAGHLLVRYEYAVTGDLEHLYNSSGLPKTYTYDIHSRITRWTDRIGDWYSYRYDDADRCVQGEGVHGVLSCTLAYDTEQRTVLYTNSLGHTTTYRHDERLNLVEVTGPLGHSLRQAWDEQGRLIAQTNELGHTTRFGYDADGNLTSLIRPDGTALSAEYNELAQPVSVTEPNGAVWHHRYDDRGRRTATVDPLGFETRYGYTDDGALATATDALGNTSRTETDAAGLPLTITDPLERTVVIERDTFGRAAAIVNALGQRTRYGWTTEGRAAWEERPDGGRETWEWDPEGHLTRYTSPTGEVLELESGFFGQLTRRTEADGSGYTFRYDTELNLVSVTNPQDRSWQYHYDPANRLIEETDYTGRSLNYRLDAVGRLAERTAGERHRVAFERDALGRITARHAEDWSVHYRYDAVGNQLSAVTGEMTVAREYDPMGRLLAESVDGRTTSYRYDGLGRRVERRTPSGAHSVWSYDAAGHPVELDAGGQRLGFRYDEASREIARSLGTGITLTQSWDPCNRLLEQVISGPGDAADAADAPLQQRSYRYQADGRPIEIRELTTGVRRFELDTVGRVTAVQAAGWTERYAYDTSGNLARSATSGARRGEQPEPGDDAEVTREFVGNQLRRSGRTHYEYDELGRPVRTVKRLLNGQRQVTGYRWNSDNRLVEVAGADGSRWRYRYDPVGRRSAKQRLSADGEVAEETLFFWDDTRLAEQITGAGEVTSWDYAPGTHRPLTQRDRTRDQAEIDARFHAIVTDLTGAPTELITPEGEIAWHLRTTLWGAELPGQGRARVRCPLRFPGQYADEESGWHYNHHRYYDPETARYLSPDPLGLAPDPNQYAYVPNPLTFIDPLGLYRNPSNGRYDRDPNGPPNNGHNRSSEYPSGYRQSTHDEMAARWTDEGRAQGGVPTDANGERIPRDQLTWRDANDRIVPSDQLTYEHREPVVDHWNREGHNTNRAARNDWYNRPDNLEPMSRSENSRGGGQMDTVYRQDTGPNYGCS